MNKWRIIAEQHSQQEMTSAVNSNRYDAVHCRSNMLEYVTSGSNTVQQWVVGRVYQVILEVKGSRRTDYYSG